MSSGEWTTVELRQVMHLNRAAVTVDRDQTYPNLGIYSFGRGVFRKPPISGSATSAPTLYRVQADQFIYSRLFAFEGAFAIVPPELDGSFVSNEYPTFDVDETQALPEFLRAAICQPRVWNNLRSQTVGMGHRRQRLHPDALLEYELPMPPVEEQRRVVDALHVAYEAVAAPAREAAEARTLLASARERLMAPLDTTRLADLVVKIEAGKSPKALNRRPTVDERGVLKVSAIRAGEFRPAEAKAIVDATRFPPHAQVREGDVLISRANTRALVGATCRVNGSFANLYLSDKTLRLVVDPAAVDPGYIVHALASQVARDHIETHATGTSDSMKNISQASLLETEVPHVGRLDEQRRIASRLDAIQEAMLRAQRAVDTATAVRLALADRLLSGERRVAAVAELAAL